MFLVHLWNYIRGYVIIIAKGGVERFINICARRQILLWDIVRKDNDSAVMKASLRGFMLMRPAARKSGCRIGIVKKCGLPFFLRRFRKRRGFKAGLLFFAVLIVFFTSMIWEIEIRGCGGDTAQRIMKVLEDRDIRKGSFKTRLDPRRIASDILMNVDDVAWAGVQIHGVKMTISVQSITPRPEVVDESQCCNLVAERDGLITKVEVLAGTLKVMEGDTVTKGQLLVSGILESQNPEFGAKNVHALGRITARTWYDTKVPLSYEYTKRIRTGRTRENTYIRILNMKIGLFGNRRDFELYDSVSYDRTVKGPFNTEIPVGLTVEKLYEVTEKKVRLSAEEAEALALEKARLDLSKELSPDCRVLDERINILRSETGDAWLQLIVECEEDIAGREPLGGD
ncbi:MAG: sporulation protein YqfD [Clostridiaceae bacterium]|jgi:similar to stage IV sporulation protein|nr:sporulation protein YqfD [Clostridiaceae bacterium]